MRRFDARTNVRGDPVVELRRIAFKEQIGKFVTFKRTEKQQAKIGRVAFYPLEQKAGDGAEKFPIAAGILHVVPELIVLAAFAGFGLDDGAIKFALGFKMLINHRLGDIERGCKFARCRATKPFSENRRTAAAMIASRRSPLFMRVLTVGFVTFTSN